MKRVFSVICVIGILVLTVVLDIVYYRVSQFDPSMAQPPISSLFWLQVLSTIIVAFALLVTFRHLLYMPPSFVVTAVSVIFGGCILLLTTVAGARFVGQLGISKSILRIWLSEVVSSGLSLTSLSSALVLCSGLIRLLPFRRHLLPLETSTAN